MASNQPSLYGPKKTEKRKVTKPYSKPNQTQKNKPKPKSNSLFFITKTRRFLHYIDPDTQQSIRMKFLGKVKPEKRNQLNQYFSQKILKNQQLSTATNGIYTWIRTQTNDIYATKIESNQEIGTLHLNLIYFVKKMINSSIKVTVSGEFEITTDELSGQKIISYNFKSGYFFKDILPTLRKELQKNNQQIQEILSSEISEILRSYCPECQIIPKLDEDFIEYTKIMSKKNVINRYRNLYNNQIIQENNIGNEKGKNNKGENMIVKFKYLVNNTKNNYSRIPISNQNQSSKGGHHHTHKNKKLI
jgi:hypothetical protein